MKRKIFKSGEDAQVDMTPMLDIVFIMLIFFIVTTSFSFEKGIFGSRPKIDASPNPTQTSLAIQIDATGQIKMAGRIVDVRRIVANTRAFLAEHNTQTAGIVAHEDTEHGIVVAVMDQLKLAGIETVSILVDSN